MILGVDQKAANGMVLGDTGTCPLKVNCYVCALRYWLKIIRVIKNHLTHRAYTMLMKLDEKDKNTFAVHSWF